MTGPRSWPRQSQPPRKDPRRRSTVPTLPPAGRSRAALGLDMAAGQGRFALQTCAECGAVQYPPRDACHDCLSVDLPWRDLSPRAEVLSVSTVHISQEPYFRERAPWRVGTLRLAAGPVVMAHLHPDLNAGDPARMALRLDRAGRGVMVAAPEAPQTEDARMTDFATDPRGRRVLVVDGAAPTGPALVRALLDAGAATVFVGEAEQWLPRPEHAALRALPGVQAVALDVTDETSLHKAAASIGGKVDILICNSHFARPGDILGRAGTHLARREIDVGCLGLIRLAQAFGPAMMGRTADGPANACAFVSLLPVGAVAPQAGWAAHSAAAAAALSVTLSLRAEMRAAGLRVCTAFAGPLDEEWRQGDPPPKLAPQQVGKAVVAMLRNGQDETWIGDVARDVAARRAADPALFEREALEAFRR